MTVYQPWTQAGFAACDPAHPIHPCPPEEAVQSIWSSKDTVVIEPSAAAPGSLTITIEDLQYYGSTEVDYRLCVEIPADGQLLAAPLVRFVRDTEGADGPGWESEACAWRVEVAEDDTVRFQSVLMSTLDDNGDVGYLSCDGDSVTSETAAQCHHQLDAEDVHEAVFFIDHNECANGTHDCAEAAWCNGTTLDFTQNDPALQYLEGYRCTCQAGYTGDGKTCTVADACTVFAPKGGCAQVCLGTTPEGTAECGCYPGFVMGADGVTCEPLPEVKLFR